MLRAMEAEIAAEEERAARVQAERQNDEVEAPPWDEVEARMAADPTIWPEAG
jgi:hypothetical protein